MKNLLVVFSHGKESGPWGSKIRALGYDNQDPTPRAKRTLIVHGWNDGAVPAQNSIRFARLHRCELYLLDGDHRLNDALPKIEPLFELFLKQVVVAPTKLGNQLPA